MNRNIYVLDKLYAHIEMSVFADEIMCNDKQAVSMCAKAILGHYAPHWATLCMRSGRLRIVLYATHLGAGRAAVSNTKM